MKKTSFFLIFFIICAIFYPRTGQAAYLTGADLIKMCVSKEEKRQSMCFGYISGIIDYHNLIRSLGTAPTVNFCVPNQMPLGDVTARVMTYLSKSPQHDDFIAAPAVAMALYVYFPCGGKARK